MKKTIRTKAQITINWPNRPEDTPLNSNQTAAQMVGLGFRALMRARQTRDKRFYDLCWRQYSHHFRPKDGLILTNRLEHWVNELANSSNRALNLYQTNAQGFSYDESMAISIIAAAHHGQCPALQACLYALTQAQNLKKAEQASEGFATSLMDTGHILPPHIITFPLTAMENGPSTLVH